MLFNVTRAVNFIVDDTKNRYFRAIKLFELYVAIRLADRRRKRSKMPTTDSSLVSALLVNVSNKKCTTLECSPPSNSWNTLRINLKR
jgi:hypothetical protein